MVAYASLAVLQLPAGRTQSGYRNVYWRPRQRQYEAAVKWGRRAYSLGLRRSPREAALLVAAWYERQYGPLWELVVRWRRAAPRKVVRESGGWVVYVWEWGRCKALGDHLHPRHPHRDRPARRPWVFPSKAAARDGLGRWVGVALPNRWGLLAGVAMHR